MIDIKVPTIVIIAYFYLGEDCDIYMVCLKYPLYLQEVKLCPGF